MSDPLVGKMCFVVKSSLIAIRGKEGFAFTRIPAGEPVRVKAVKNTRTGLLVATWNSSEILLFQENLQVSPGT